MPRTRIDFTDDGLVKLAFARIAGLKSEGKLTEYKELEAQFGHTASVLAKNFPKPFEKNLVELRVVDPGTRPERVPTLERRIKAQFGLASAVVVSIHLGQGTTLELGDDAHKQLGEAMADIIASGTLFRDDDRIGIGSGRGVYHVVSRLAESETRFGLRNVSLISLAGTVHPKHHARQPNVRLDADFHVQILGSCFSQRVDPQFAIYPIVCGSAHKLSVLRKGTSLDPDKLAKRPPTHAIVGVGVLTQGHRLYEVARSSVSNTPLFKAIRKPLNEVIDLAEKYSTPTHCPVGDVANHLLLLSAPPGARPLNEKTLHRIRILIKDINSRLLTITDRHLQSIGSMILVAGTPRKASAIYEMLTNSRYNVHHLCTDQQTAEIILQMSQVPQPASAH